MIVPKLKEAFAFNVDVDAREQAIQKHAAAGSDDWYYYRGLVLLQKLHQHIGADPTERAATAPEAQLVQEMETLIRQYATRFAHAQRLRELQARFYLLAYPIHTNASADFIQRELGLDLPSSDAHPATPLPSHKHTARDPPQKRQFLYPYVLQDALIDSRELVKEQLSKNSSDLDIALSLPLALDLVQDTTQERVLLRQLSNMRHPDARALPLLIRHLQQTTLPLGQALEEAYVSLERFTLEQLETLRASVPDLINVTAYIQAHIAKLAPPEIAHVDSSAWDDDQDIKKSYVTRLLAFSHTLPQHSYQAFKATVLFHFLRIAVARHEFNHIKQFKEFHDELVYVRKNSGQNGPHMNHIMYLGNCPPNQTEQTELVAEFMAGAITQGHLSNEALRAFRDYERELQITHASIMISRTKEEPELWSGILGNHRMNAIMEGTELRFDFSTSHRMQTRLPDDPVRVQIWIKNIPHLTVRVFSVDLFQYWRLHANTSDFEPHTMQLDGLCPTWQMDKDYSQTPAIEMHAETLDFSQEPVFRGRGAWVIDFVGGRENCRMVVQKGQLRHVVQTTSAGHLFRILDENNGTVQDAKIWFKNQFYKADNTGNILVPYKTEEDEDGTYERILLVSPDGFCTHDTFYHCPETYELSADFFVHHESLIPNRTAKVTVIPHLTIHNQPVSLSLLDNVSLTGEVTNARNIKSSFTKDKLSVSASEPITFEFTVPNLLRELQLTLHARVQRVMQGSQTLETSYKTTYQSVAGDDELASMHLRTNEQGEYLLQVLGKNGEALPAKVVQLNLGHAMVTKVISVRLQTDDNGMVELGKLEHITSIQAMAPVHKFWDFSSRMATVLPQVLHLNPNAPFTVAYPKGDLGLCTLYQMGAQDTFLHDLSEKIVVEPTHIKVEGLPVGHYKIIVEDAALSHTIECHVADSVTQQDEAVSPSVHWKNWIMGRNTYLEGSQTKPLYLDSIEISQDNVTLQTVNWSNHTFALVTTTAFVPPEKTSLADRVVNRNLRAPTRLDGHLKTPDRFVAGRKLDEEYEYILNRLRTEKRVGSTLTKPSLLVHPEKQRETHAKEREIQGGEQFTRLSSNMRHRKIAHGAPMFYARNIAKRGGASFAMTDANFLNHQYPVLCFAANENGTITIDRSIIGDGNILQVAILSGDQQALARQIVLSSNLDLKLSNLCHKSDDLDLNQAYVRTNSIRSLASSNATLELDRGQHEWEVIGDFQKLFDLLKVLVDAGADDLGAFDFLKSWSGYSEKDKLNKYKDVVCHEFHFWLKRKDPVFFDKHVKPLVASKLQKDFMDLYLTDQDLSHFANDLYLYQRLSPAEKVLLSDRVLAVKPIVQKEFQDALENNKGNQEALLDRKFDTVLAGSTLAPEPEEEVEDMGMALFSDGSAYSAAPSRAAACFGAAMSPESMPFSASSQPLPEEPSAASGSANHDSQSAVDELTVEEREKEEATLREALKLRQYKKPYQFIEPTSEWAEKTWYKPGDTRAAFTINKFWLSYMECTEQKFASSELLHATTSFSQAMLALALLDIPFQSDARWELDCQSEKNKISIVAHTPIIVFYRSLQKAEEIAPASTHVFVGQGFFVQAESGSSGDIDMVDPEDMRPGVIYGWHLAVSNVSPKRVTGEITMQVPVGAIPSGLTPYCQSRTVSLEPYMTLREVVGTFYFPTYGEFTHFSVTVAHQGRLLSQTQPVKIHVRTKEDKKPSGMMSWTTLTSEGSDDAVIEHLKQANLTEADMKRLQWRMINRDFCERVLTVLRERRHYSAPVWPYALVHHLAPAVAELVRNQNNGQLLKQCGVVFNSPLVSIRPDDTGLLKWMDYFPLIHSRVHRFGSNNEIMNSEFFEQYNKFLDYLSQSTELLPEDRLVLATYLVLQDRIGEAQAIHADIQHDDSIQAAYLNAYLMTVPSEVDVKTTDLGAVRAIADKYIAIGDDRWQKLFKSLVDFVDEVEQSSGSLEDDITKERLQSRAMLSEPALDVDITMSQDSITLNYCNIHEAIQIRYYQINVEVMFSSSPFMSRHTSGASYSWVEPTYTETVAPIPSDRTDDEDKTDEAVKDDFEVIGAGLVRTHTQRIAVPSELVRSNTIVEVTTSGLRRQKARFAHGLLVHFVEAYGILRVADKDAKRPVAGAYVKVYARHKSGEVRFWKDGYTGLNGAFDYVSVTDGLNQGATLKDTVTNQIDKFSLLVQSSEHGAVVEEIFPPQ